MKSLLTAKFIGLLIRHFLTVAGGFMVAQGYADETTWQTVSGGGMALLAVATSVIEKAGRLDPA